MIIGTIHGNFYRLGGPILGSLYEGAYYPRSTLYVGNSQMGGALTLKGPRSLRCHDGCSNHSGNNISDPIPNTTNTSGSHILVAGNIRGIPETMVGRILILIYHTLHTMYYLLYAIYYLLFMWSFGVLSLLKGL